MVNKRGLTPVEFEEVDDELLQYLMVFDSFIEPSGIKMDMLFHAHLCQSLTLNNPNMTKDIAQKIKMTDYDFMGILDEGTTKERRENREKTAKAKQEDNNKSYIASRLKAIQGRNNGK